MKLICPRGFMAISDGHSSPDDGLPPAVWRVAEKASELRCPLILNGDMLDLILYGRKAYTDGMSTLNISSLYEWPPGLNPYIDVYYILGNHEGRIEWLRKLFKGSNVHVCKTLDIDVNGKKFHLEHGDRFAFDWNHLGFLFKGVAFFMLRFAPKLWLRLTRKWQPGAMKAGAETGSYTFTVMRIWENAFQDALKHKRVNVIGHTHSALSMMGADIDFIYDCGDSRDGSAVYVDGQGNGSIKFFGGKE